MPGLSFLSKKSWHVKNLDNQERVWLAEQAKAAEDAKTKELADQIKQEREAEELARKDRVYTKLHRKAGLPTEVRTPFPAHRTRGARAAHNDRGGGGEARPSLRWC